MKKRYGDVRNRGGWTDVVKLSRHREVEKTRINNNFKS